eukprot:TRINITY_DN4541_c0_g1_i1.p1 TRINITY_DN4541_c0_g1~~TRINITY_DN4541_c0_g1_i1.p1  ORF type:complete len:658 (+),score=121.06 TRINITY_DN4541_c0_g1_i1:135-2108(+)
MGLTVSKPVAQSKSFSSSYTDESGRKIYRTHSVAGADTPLMQGTVEVGGVTCDTLYSAFLQSSRLHAHNPYLGWRSGEGSYKFMSYSSASTRATYIGSAMVDCLKLIPHRGRVGLYSINRPEWTLTAHAADIHSLALVPLYDTLGPEVVQYITKLVNLEVVFCAGDKVDCLLQTHSEMPSLRAIISFDSLSLQQIQDASALGVQLLTLDALEKEGEASPQPPHPPSPSEVQTIMFTSGTTGHPKGVLLTHTNILANIAGIATRMTLCDSDVHISYLPLAHSFERLMMNSVFVHGASAGFYRGDVRKLFSDITALRPTLFASVPRLWNRLYDKVMASVKASSSMRRALFHLGFETKLERLREGEISHPFWDMMVFSKIQNALGGRVRVMLTGSAPLSETVMEFLRVCFSCPVFEGYGQTENAACLTSTLREDFTVGHVGVPIPSVELSLVDVPSQNYLVSDSPNPRGEVCFRGPVATVGYFENEQKTTALIDEDGWRHTGDIGEILPNGNLRIIDRSKNIFKLSLGEYIAPERLEGVYVQSQYVEQIFVYGNSLKSKLVAIVVPDLQLLREWTKSHPLSSSSSEVGGEKENVELLLQEIDVIKLIVDDLVALAEEHKLRGFEKLGRIHLTSEAFLTTNDLVTPTFKLKRPQIQRRYQS